MKKKELQALKVEQPLGSFFVTTIKAKDLLEISFSEPLEYMTEKGEMKGNQRKIDENRLKHIGAYIDTAEMTFPNTIILSVNHNLDGSLIDEKDKRWEIIENECGFKLLFPLGIKSASIIDGQHRITGFTKISNQERLNIDLVCSIFFELPNPYQAYLFATINGNQKKVDKGLALEQWGYYIDNEEPISWTPEKLAASICRRLNFNTNSPVYGRIKLSPIYNNDVFIEKNKDWIVSTATMMEGILSLISSNYKRDRIEMMNKRIFKGRSRDMVRPYRDSSPLRNLYLEGKDKEIESIILDFFNTVNNVLWKNCDSESYIKKTVGVQALFYYLKVYLKDSREFSNKMLDHASDIDFSDNYFQASGIGKTRIQNVLLISGGMKSISDLKNIEEQEEIRRIIK